MDSIYSTFRWRAARSRALARDERRCTVSRLLGGECNGRLDVHHIVPVQDGGAPFDLDNLGTACKSHHPVWEALRRSLIGRLRVDEEDTGPPRCRHQHRSLDARLICEARLARRHQQERTSTRTSTSTRTVAA